MFSCETWLIFNIFFFKAPPLAASGNSYPFQVNVSFLQPLESVTKPLFDDVLGERGKSETVAWNEIKHPHPSTFQHAFMIVRDQNWDQNL